jgi:hypothetical protein
MVKMGFKLKKRCDANSDSNNIRIAMRTCIERKNLSSTIKLYLRFCNLTICFIWDFPAAVLALAALETATICPITSEMEWYTNINI